MLPDNRFGDALAVGLVLLTAALFTVFVGACLSIVVAAFSESAVAGVLVAIGATILTALFGTGAVRILVVSGILEDALSVVEELWPRRASIYISDLPPHIRRACSVELSQLKVDYIRPEDLPRIMAAAEERQKQEARISDARTDAYRAACEAEIADIEKRQRALIPKELWPFIDRQIKADAKARAEAEPRFRHLSAEVERLRAELAARGGATQTARSRADASYVRKGSRP